MKPITLQSWSPEAWTAALLKLCDRQEVETEAEIVRYPEQWLYCLWKPSQVALPFRRPDCYGFSVGAPFVPIQRDVASAPVYVARDDECYWPALLDIPLACDALEPWLTNLLRQHREEQLFAAHRRDMAWYGSEVGEFQRFLKAARALPGGKPGEPGG